MRRRWLWWVLAVAIVLAAAFVLRSPRADRITPENYARVQPGMTRAEVEAILGPPGDFRKGPSNAPNPALEAADAVTGALARVHGGTREADRDIEEVAARITVGEPAP